MPPATLALLVVNVAVFLLEGVFPLGGFALWPPGDFDSHFQAWQMLTYAFLHGGAFHLLFNMLGLYMFGGEIERLFGTRYFIAYYFACVFAAALGHLLVSDWLGGPAVPMVGASGGVYGVLLAFGVYFPRRIVMLLFPPIPLPARVFVFAFAALELVLGVTQTAAGVAHFAHLGGMLGGWLMIQYRREGFPFGKRNKR